MFIELILNDESFEGHVEVGIKSNTFKLESIPSAQIKTYEPDEAIDRGFYLLTSKPNQASEKFEVYVGESKDLVTRIKRHLLDEKKVFEQALIMYDVAGEMSGDHAKYIEETLIQFLNTHPNVTCGNGNKGQAPKLKPKHAKYCKDILEKTALVLQTLGYSFMRDWGLEAHAIRAKYALPETLVDIPIEPVEVIEFTPESSASTFNFSQFPIFEYRFPSKKFTHRKGWVARMKVTGVDSFTLLKGSYIEANDEYRACRKGCKGKAGDFALSYFKEKSKKLYFNPEEHAKFDQKSEAYITKVKLIFTAPSSPLDVALGRANNGWKEWKTADGETLEAVNARLGNPLGRK